MEMYDQVRLWYDNVLNQTDVRSRSWLLMGSPVPPLATMGAYLAVVYCGSKVMGHRRAWDLKAWLVFYNLALVALSTYMCSEVNTECFYWWLSRNSTVCCVSRWTLRPNALRMLNVCWCYYFPKYIELADTVCFILRKKNGQITFLHVYHHATMIPFWWMAAAYVPGGQTFFHPLLNTGIHVMMYTYYGLAALGPHMQPYLWWKKYLTSLQLLQFVLIAVHTGYNLWFQPHCPYPKFWDALALLYALVLIVLFANFYRHAYNARHAPWRPPQSGVAAPADPGSGRKGETSTTAGSRKGDNNCQNTDGEVTTTEHHRAKGD